MQISIKLDNQCKVLLLCILACLVWLCLASSQGTSQAIGDEKPTDKKKPSVADVLATRKLYIFDEDDKGSIILSAGEGGPTLMLLGSRDNDRVVLNLNELVFTNGGHPRIGMHFNDMVSRFFLENESDEANLDLSVTTSGDARISLENKKGSDFTVVASNKGYGSLSINGPRERGNIDLLVTPDGASTITVGILGELRLRAYASRSEAGMSIQDGKKNTRFSLGAGHAVRENRPPSWIQVFDDDGKMSWSAPPKSSSDKK